MAEPTVLIVPGLRDAVPQHWQTLLEAQLPRVRSVPPMGRSDLSCPARVEAIERAVRSIEGQIVIVAHSGGCIMVAHWARRSVRAIEGALLATPPDFETPMPAGYPTLEQLDAAGWLPVPRAPLPFRSIVAASSNDPLGSFDLVAALAHDWCSELVAIGPVGHLNPASGHGEWPPAHDFIARLSAAHRTGDSHAACHPLP